MKKTFLVMTDPEKGAREDNWTIMNAFEFARFMETEEGKRRADCFEMLDMADGDDEILYMETGKVQARKAKNEKNHSDYLRRQEEESGYETVSLDAPAGISMEGDESTLLDMIADENMDTEDMALKEILKRELDAALEKLNHDELDMMLAIYVFHDDMTINSYALQRGITLHSAYRTHRSALRKLRFHFRVKKLI